MEDTKLFTVGDKTYRKYTKNILQDDEEFIQEIENIQLNEEIKEEKFTIEPQFIKFIIGKQGATKNKIQNKTNVKIIIPDKKLNSNQISNFSIFELFSSARNRKFNFTSKIRN
jgi:polyribonucleotide nucleotidyltransferase